MNLHPFPKMPVNSIALFDMPHKIVVTCDVDDFPIERIKMVNEALTGFLHNEDCKVIFLPHDLNLMFFYKPESKDALDTNVNRGDIFSTCPEAGGSNAGLAGGGIEGGEEPEDDH
jgi:hypothetical protein